MRGVTEKAQGERKERKEESPERGPWCSVALSHCLHPNEEIPLHQCAGAAGGNEAEDEAGTEAWEEAGSGAEYGVEAEAKA